MKKEYYATDDLNSGNTPPNNEPEKQVPKWKKYWYVILIVVVVLGFGVFLYLKNRNYNSTYTVESTTAVYPNAQEFELEDQDGWSTLENYDYWKSAIFTIPQWQNLPLRYQRGITKIFMDNHYLEPKEGFDIYHLTKITDRVKHTYCYGNFTNIKDLDDSHQDFAFLAEKNDFQSSEIFILSYKGDMLYWKTFDNELPLINSFKKGAKIYMSSDSLVASPVDGIIVKNKYDKFALVYNKTTKTFDTFHQYTKEEIDEMKAEREREYDETEEDETEIDSTAIHH